jgi:hypothetical protein
MGLQESRGKIARSMRDLMGLWANTKVHWNDVNSEQFEEKFLRTLEQDVRIAASAMDEMASMLTRIKAECE